MMASFCFASLCVGLFGGIKSLELDASLEAGCFGRVRYRVRLPWERVVDARFDDDESRTHRLLTCMVAVEGK